MPWTSTTLTPLDSFSELEAAMLACPCWVDAQAAVGARLDAASAAPNPMAALPAVLRALRLEIFSSRIPIEAEDSGVDIYSFLTYNIESRSQRMRSFRSGALSTYPRWQVRGL